jgi:formate hydrogenlyase subunit 3/multisubunit Na+/H+ antiporter MnhD subunit
MPSSYNRWQAGDLITGSLAVIGVPLLPIFLSKLNILASLAEYSLIVLGIVLVLLFFIASSMGYYMVRSLSRNEEEEQLEPYHVPSSMKWPIVIVIFILFVLGVYFPDVLADLLNGIIKDLKY